MSQESTIVATVRHLTRSDVDINESRNEIGVLILSQHMDILKLRKALLALAVALRNEGLHSIVDEVEKELNVVIGEGA